MSHLILKVLRDHQSTAGTKAPDLFQVDHLMLVADRRAGFQVNRTQSHRVLKELVAAELVLTSKSEIGRVAEITPAGLVVLAGLDRRAELRRLALWTLGAAGLIGLLGALAYVVRLH